MPCPYTNNYRTAPSQDRYTATLRICAGLDNSSDNGRHEYTQPGMEAANSCRHSTEEEECPYFYSSNFSPYQHPSFQWRRLLSRKFNMYLVTVSLFAQHGGRLDLPGYCERQTLFALSSPSHCACLLAYCTVIIIAA